MTADKQGDACSQPGEVALERTVRPVCWRINAMQGTDRPPLWHYVTEPWANFESAPLYDQATLDAAVAAERERWKALRAWAEQARKEHEAGQMMSIAESIHGASALRDVLNQMAKLEGPNV